MKDLFDVFQAIRAGERQAYLDTMKHCDTRETADEGIPTVIALDDLTRQNGDNAFESAKADRDMGVLLAAEALIYSSLYEALYSKESSKYPSICPAMSAAIEDCFRVHYCDSGEIEVLQYRKEIKNLISSEENLTGL